MLGPNLYKMYREKNITIFKSVLLIRFQNDISNVNKVFSQFYEIFFMFT